MLVNKTSTMNAVCRLTEDGEDIMSLSGNLNTNGTYSVNRYIHNRALYCANKLQMEEDEEEFEDALVGLLGATVADVSASTKEK